MMLLILAVSPHQCHPTGSRDTPSFVRGVEVSSVSPLFARRCRFSSCFTMSFCNFHVEHCSSSSAADLQVLHYRKLAKESEAQVEQVSVNLFVASNQIRLHVLLTRDERMLYGDSHI